MKSVLRLFKPLLILNYKRPYALLSVALFLAVVGGYYALQLKVDTNIANLLPEDYESVKALEKLKQTVGGESALKVIIQSPSFEDNKRFAETLIDRALNMQDEKRDKPFFERAVFEKDTRILEENALYFATEEELGDITSYLEDEIENAKLKANPFYFEVEEETEEDKEQQKKQLKEFEESYDALIPKHFPISNDSTIMLVELYPTGSKSNIGFLQDMFSSTDSLVTAVGPTSFNNNMEVMIGGRLERHLLQLNSIMKDVTTSFSSGIASVLFLVMIYFFMKKFLNYVVGTGKGRKRSLWRHVKRLPIPLLVIGIPLLVSLAWTFGITYWYLGSLNTMTSVLFVILFGLGIDYGIHYYARYIEIRSSGTDILNSLIQTYEKTGSAIIISGLTTAAALYVLLFADFRGFYEFGFISGNGIVLTLFTMLFILPSLLVIFERFNWILIYEKDPNSGNGKVASKRPYPLANTIVVAGLTAAVLVIAYSGELKFQYDFGELEPKFEQYQEFRSLEKEVHTSKKRNPAYVMADTDQEVMEILQAIRQKKKQDTLSPTIDEVEALQERFPTSDSAEQQKLKRIAEIRDLLQDPFLRDQEDPQLEKLREASQTTEPLQVEQIPSYLRERFTTKEGEVGRFVMIYPSVGLSDGRKSIEFMHDVGEITTESGKTYYAASTSIIAAKMLELMKTESPYMVFGTFVIILMMMYLAFRNIKWTIIGMLPLVVGLLWTFGIMILFDISFNFYNLVVLPAILGIGEDNGVHLAHRYRIEGRGSVWTVLSSTGQHVTIGSLTTMLGFSGLLFTHHPGLQTIGVMAVLGIGMTLFSALTFLPALIQFLENRQLISFDTDHIGEIQGGNLNMDGKQQEESEQKQPIEV